MSFMTSDKLSAWHKIILPQMEKYKPLMIKKSKSHGRNSYDKRMQYSLEKSWYSPD